MQAEPQAPSMSYGWRSAQPTEAFQYLLPAILPLIPGTAGQRILDLGCGNGALAGFLAKKGHEVVGIDGCPDGVEIARQTYPAVQFHCRRLEEDLAAVVREVDVVVATEVLEHLYRPASLVENAFRVLRPGGTLIVTTPHHGYWKNLALSLCGAWDRHFTVDWDGGHIKFFSDRTLGRLLRNHGFEGLSIRHAGRVPWLWKSVVCAAQKPVEPRSGI